jgi:hypothetical protein
MKRSVLEATAPVVIVLGVLAGMPLGALAQGENFLNDPAMRDLSPADRELQRDAALSVLENPEAQAAREWQNPGSGDSGRAQATGHFTSDDGLRCRKLHLSSQAQGRSSQLEFPVCKDAGGLWFIASGKKLTEVR